MKEFKVSLKKRMYIMGGVNAVAVIFIALTSVYTNRMPSNDISDMIHGFQIGIFLGIEIVMLLLMGKYTKALRDENELKKLYIEENDERTKMINDKIGVTGFNFALGIIGAVAVAAGFINQLVFFTLAGVIIFMALVKAVLKIYYGNKF
ncbi:putative membrane protein [Clostridium acetobutylicum]|uniref:Predicted membrane protein n=1 Tax=Clostridium acetobutylicum (strain ATCC 824 / DSM 792 / JCM 1419 / IAM 19013 / LMG 5710 / NBRC 13948 / NRRL B-527 / VKM B-1787 / 2291 / W) TaxID=272562 RepID=Q97DZ7_CLOAB|nr:MULTISPECIES: hypothetical protein [Clostridium]AAK81255.1 Predicted membrane protein [Clostridium acetobutylicum ATCC 824]ADZ22363.1 membrane protein [Clostridium acetobutylicum EA 2018]AEI32770.1 hypothetical protein SMB_G3360 [Clostridium acetobutylicum DSM 1731]AWV81077.1 hypothetical protein DK921_13395 [Clostridium acetobutylicum]MBC2395593.1 hypothetical protein [Clostridium acetobutylicum]